MPPESYRRTVVAVMSSCSGFNMPVHWLLAQANRSPLAISTVVVRIDPPWQWVRRHGEGGIAPAGRAVVVLHTKHKTEI